MSKYTNLVKQLKTPQGDYKVFKNLKAALKDSTKELEKAHMSYLKTLLDTQKSRFK